LVVPITIPPLAGRPDEIDQIITEYAEDPIRELGALRTSFLPADPRVAQPQRRRRPARHDTMH